VQGRLVTRRGFKSIRRSTCERPKRELIDSIRAIARRNGMVVPKNDGSLVAATSRSTPYRLSRFSAFSMRFPAFEVGESVVRAGGYGSIQEAVDDVTASVEKEWIKPPPRRSAHMKQSTNARLQRATATLAAGWARNCAKLANILVCHRDEVARHLRVPRTALTNIESGQRRD